MSQSLIEKAKGHEQKRNRAVSDISDESIDLAIAFLKKEVTLTQICFALYGQEKFHSGAVYIFITRAIQKAFADGKIKLE